MTTAADIPNKRYDTIIVGGGHNGLVCAAYLARAGQSVLVLEKRHVLGGAAVTEEIHPGFKYSSCSYVVSLLRPEIIRDLNLPRFGLEILPLESSFTPQLDGRGLVRGPDADETRREIAAFSQRDAEIYPEFGREMMQVGRMVKPILEMVPPDPASFHPARLWEMFKFGRLMDRLSEAERVLQARMFTMSAIDFLDQWFEGDLLKATMGVSGIIGTFQGVRSPGTAYVLLHHYMGEIDGSFRAWGLAKGGTGQISLSIADAARSLGADIRTEAGVAQILVRDDEACGVVLEDGREIRSRRVVSALDPHRTFLGLCDPADVDPEFAGAIRKFKMRGSSGKVNLALDRFPEFACRPGVGPHVRGDVAIAPSVAYLERAFDEAKYGRFSKRPYINVVFPSLTDPSVAPPGKHVMSCFVQYAPYALEGGPDGWPDQREAFGDAVVDTLAEYCPTLKDSILHRHVLTPWDLEKEYGLTEGNIFHGELSLEQLFFLRPAPSWTRYKTPIPKLWMCASGTHPGGGIMGASGANAAREILRA